MFGRAVGWVIAALIIASSSIPVVAARPPQPSRSDIDEAKASLAEMVDEAFLAFWNTRQSRAAELGISASVTRQMFRWIAPGYSLGNCSSFLTHSEKADWITGLDRMILTADAGGEALLGEIRLEGEKLFRQGASDPMFVEMSADRKQAYCSVELAAVREFLAE